MKKYIFLIASIFIAQFNIAQVLFTEDFNSYSTGHLNNNYTNNTPGQGGWVIRNDTKPGIIVTAMVTPENGKGNILNITNNGAVANRWLAIQQSIGVIDGLWNNRMVGNNVLKLEYEVYGSGSFHADGRAIYNNSSLIDLYINSPSFSIEAIHINSINTNRILKNYTASTFPNNIWIKIELFIDYTNQKAYYYIPTLNLFRADNISPNNYIPQNIDFIGYIIQPGSVVKYDNIKLTALPSVPSYILSANEMVSAKFNMYPNPATNVVNITNSENMLVEQVTVYDINGKQVTTQNYNSEQQIQINVENLASGTYMLHIKTNTGLAIKQLVKK
ncbi:T9SS type A sorting domain-containing protein [Paenimyroides viscosum]|uniref:T9SS C-terminal target domain-containing protein n=1 Tax=Paenimyroides viscosum TaxID=2488729 RepID=A0A3P1AWN0_9FLAO|nr:T9SS type A sorting domain-containing protein [Paenimyroides viscosum]RRA93298.1 T9SS C-terminal target domain-containing protein [Paenimyroides viscosum]